MARLSRSLLVVAIAVTTTLAACGSSVKPVAEPTPASSPDAAAACSPDASTAQHAAPAPDGASATKLLFVRETFAECEGEGRMRCLHVRESESEPWQLHYGRIEGFRYEEGTRYTLRVETRDVGSQKADAPSTGLRLVEIVSQEKVSNVKQH